MRWREKRGDDREARVENKRPPNQRTSKTGQSSHAWNGEKGKNPARSAKDGEAIGGVDKGGIKHKNESSIL